MKYSIGGILDLHRDEIVEITLFSGVKYIAFVREGNGAGTKGAGNVIEYASLVIDRIMDVEEFLSGYNKGKFERISINDNDIEHVERCNILTFGKIKYFKVSYRFVEDSVEDQTSPIYVYASERQYDVNKLKQKIKEKRFRGFQMAVLSTETILITKEEYDQLAPQYGDKK